MPGPARARAMGEQGVAGRTTDPRARPSHPNPDGDARPTVRTGDRGPGGARVRAGVRDRAQGPYPGADLRRGRHPDGRGARRRAARGTGALRGRRGGLDGRVRVARTHASDLRDAHTRLGRALQGVRGDLAAGPRGRGPAPGRALPGARGRVRGPDPPVGAGGVARGRAARDRHVARGLRAHLQAGARPAPSDRGGGPRGGRGPGQAGPRGGQPRGRRLHGGVIRTAPRGTPAGRMRAMSSPYGELSVIVNPHAGRRRVGEEVPELERTLRARGLSYRLLRTEGPGDATRLASEALEAGGRFVVAVGGDGTLHEVVNGMFDGEGKPLVADAVLGVVAAGSGCDFVRTFGLPGDATRACHHLAGDNTYPLDVGKVTYTTAEGGRAT